MANKKWKHHNSYSSSFSLLQYLPLITQINTNLILRFNGDIFYLIVLMLNQFVLIREVRDSNSYVFYLPIIKATNYTNSHQLN